MGNISHPKVHQIAAAQLAVDGEVEHSQLANLLVELEMYPDGPDVFLLERWFLTNQLAFVPRFMVSNVFHFKLLFG
jgi:hypothetical protein